MQSASVHLLIPSIETNNKQISNLDYGGERLKFFNINQPFSMSISDFEIKWPEVSNIWVQVGQTKRLTKDPLGWTKTYDG